MRAVARVLDQGRLAHPARSAGAGSAQVDFFGREAFDRDPPAPADLVEADLAFAELDLPLPEADLAFAVAPPDRDAERSPAEADEDFAFALAFAFAWGRALDRPDFDSVGESDAFTAVTALAPAFVTASAPSATTAPIERRTPPALRPTAEPDRFTDFATSPAASATGFLTRRGLLLRFLPEFMGTSWEWDSVPNALHFAIHLEGDDGHPPRLRIRTKVSFEYSQFSCRFISV
jgi:hypothetical protein